MIIKILSEKFTVCKVNDLSQINFNDTFLFVGKTDKELSLVCQEDSLPFHCTTYENGWRAFRFEGELDFSLIGILSEVTKILAENQIAVFAVSTFNTDYILIKETMLETAISALSAHGYQIV